MVTTTNPEQLEKSARNQLACAKWMYAEKQARLQEDRPAMKEIDIDRHTRELFGINWGSAYNALRTLEKLGEGIVEESIQRGIAFSSLYPFTRREDPVNSFYFVMEEIDEGRLTGRPSFDRIAEYLQKNPLPENYVPKGRNLRVEPLMIEERVPEEHEETVEESPAPVEERPELTGLDTLLSPYQTRFSPYKKPRHGLMIMKTPAHLPISRGRRAIVDSKNVLDEESLMHMKIFVVAQASNGKVYVSRQFSWLTMDHFDRETKNKDRETYISMRVKEIRGIMESEFKERNLRFVMSEEILTAARSHVTKFLREHYYLVGEYKL